MKKIALICLSLILLNSLISCEDDSELSSEPQNKYQNSKLDVVSFDLQSKEDFSNRTKLNFALEKLETSSNPMVNYSESNSNNLIVNTDSAIYTAYGDKHSFTYFVSSNEETNYLENVVLEYDDSLGEYKAFLFSYLGDVENPLKIKRLNLSDIEGFNACEPTLDIEYISCSSTEHHSGNVHSWSECTADVKPSIEFSWNSCGGGGSTGGGFSVNSGNSWTYDPNGSYNPNSNIPNNNWNNPQDNNPNNSSNQGSSDYYSGNTNDNTSTDSSNSNNLPLSGIITTPYNRDIVNIHEFKINGIKEALELNHLSAADLNFLQSSYYFTSKLYAALTNTNDTENFSKELIQKFGIGVLGIRFADSYNELLKHTIEGTLEELQPDRPTMEALIGAIRAMEPENNNDRIKYWFKIFRNIAQAAKIAKEKCNALILNPCVTSIKLSFIYPIKIRLKNFGEVPNYQANWLNLLFIWFFEYNNYPENATGTQEMLFPAFSLTTQGYNQNNIIIEALKNHDSPSGNENTSEPEDGINTSIKNAIDSIVKVDLIQDTNQSSGTITGEWSFGVNQLSSDSFLEWVLGSYQYTISWEQTNNNPETYLITVNVKNGMKWSSATRSADGMPPIFDDIDRDNDFELGGNLDLKWTWYEIYTP